jgi:hypothetical protein
MEVNPATTSRVELEPYGAKLARQGDRAFDLELIRAELAARVWQWHNPYAYGWPPELMARNVGMREPPPGTPLPATRPKSRHPGK